MKNIKKTLLEEIESILDKNDICSYMDTNISEVKYRLTPMIIGLFTDVNCKTVNTWLHRMGEEQLSPRNAFEAMFIYVYTKFSGNNGKEKAKKWQHLFKTYNNTIQSTLINKDPVMVETFEDLCAVLKNDSEPPNGFRTFATKNYTSQVIYPKLEEAINSNEEDSFEQYLLFLNNDESISSYQRKATYYLRRFMYEIIMDGIYLLYDRHQYDVTKDENAKSRKAAFSSDESFNKYIKYNCICLENIKKPKGYHSNDTLRSVMRYDRKADTILLNYDECKKWLSLKNISYSSLRFSFYELFGNINEMESLEYFLLGLYIWKNNGIYNIEGIEYSDYNAIRKAFVSEKKDMPILEEGQLFMPDKDDTGTAKFLIKKYIDFQKKDNRNTYNNLFKDMISGKVNVSRRMLLLFGIFAGYEYNELNNILLKCGFEVLSHYSTFDKAIISLVADEYMKTRKKHFNDELFLLKSNDFNYDKKEEYKEEEIEIPRSDYLHLLAQQFILIENDTSLPTISDIFLNDRMKNILERQNKELAKINIKIKKM